MLIARLTERPGTIDGGCKNEKTLHCMMLATLNAFGVVANEFAMITNDWSQGNLINVLSYARQRMV